MTVSSDRIGLTYEDYLDFPEDGLRHELIEGDHAVTPAPSTRHQRIVRRLFRHLDGFVTGGDLGEVFVAPYDVLLSEADVVQPDLLFVAREHLDRITAAHLRGAPDLVVEIVSEATRRRDEVTKRHLYERHGVVEYWVVDPVIETVKIFRPGPEGRYVREVELSLEADGVLTSPLFPGFELPLGEIFGREAHGGT